MRLQIACFAIRFFSLLLPLLAVSSLTWAERCEKQTIDGEVLAGSWGLGVSNHRFQSNTVISPSNVQALSLAWVFQIDKKESPHTWPLVTEDAVIIGGRGGVISALNKNSGCILWQQKPGKDLRTAFIKGEEGLFYYGDMTGHIFARKLSNGELVWKQKVDDHRFALSTGTPVYHDGILYAPKSSIEMFVAVLPVYNCCTFRGGVRAMNAKTGEVIWDSFTIDESAVKQKSRFLLLKDKGPSGAPVWSAPALDPVNNRLYIGTGENYSEPGTKHSDAIIALDMKTGERLWSNQFTESDVWNLACETLVKTNCPESNGPDFDFGAPPMVLNNIVVAGQKSGMVYGMRADNGERLWEFRSGSGGKLGGIHWGLAAKPSENTVYVSVSDRDAEWPTNHSTVGEAMAGLVALDARTGKQKWRVLHTDTCENKSKQCYEGISAALLASPGLVWAGGMDGVLRAYSETDGAVLWQYDTWEKVNAVNGEAQGGTIDVHGPMVIGDMVFVTSGYAGFGQKGGNAFYAFRLAAK